MSSALNRRQLLQSGMALLGAGSLSQLLAASQAKPKKILFFTKSSGFQHSVITRKGDELSHAEKILTELGNGHGFEVVASKDGRLFNPDVIGQWDAFVFETTGDLTKEGTDKTPPMSAEGEKALYEAVRGGKGFVALHCGSDTFGHHRGMGADDPYIQMVGGEFAGHGAQQEATIDIVDTTYPGVKALGDKSFKITDEFYAQKNIADDLHVILVQNTTGMKGNDYDRPNFPQTWSRMHGNGRVFYSSFGHREDVWDNPKIQGLFLGGLAFVTGKIDLDTAPNISSVTPGYKQLGKK
jgi:type 1 glutamine amidotransferase